MHAACSTHDCPGFMEPPAIFPKTYFPPNNVNAELCTHRGAFCWPSICSLERHNPLWTEARCALPRQQCSLAQLYSGYTRLCLGSTGEGSVDIRLNFHGSCPRTEDMVWHFSGIVRIVENRSDSGIKYSLSSTLACPFASLLAAWIVRTSAIQK